MFQDELPSLDPELYKNLNFLKNYEGDCEDLGLNFTIDRDVFGEIKTFGTTNPHPHHPPSVFTHSFNPKKNPPHPEIKPGGASIPVTNETKYEYMHLMADYRLNRECGEQFGALIRGFRGVVRGEWVRFFGGGGS